MPERFRVVRLMEYVLNGHSRVRLWDAAGEAPGLTATHKALGVTMAQSTSDHQVAILQSGPIHRVTDVLEETWEVGDLLWASESASGLISKNRPPAPLPQVYVGTVTDNNGDGTYEVDVNLRVLPMISEMSGVKLVADPPDRTVLVYHSGDQIWWPQSPHQTREISESTEIQSTELWQDTILLNASGGPFLLTLPSCTAGLGAMRFTLKKVDPSRNRILITTASGSQPIDDRTWQDLRLQGESLTLQADDAQWWVV